MMTDAMKTSSVAACGFATSILTALLVTVASRLTSMDLYTFSVWFVIPIGAILTGLAAASGYYYGCLYYHVRPNRLLFAQMVVIAASTQLLIYYIQYDTFILNDGRRISEFMSFKRFVDVSLTSAHYKVGHAMQTDTGEVGSLGYGFAGLQFLGFMIGGALIYGALLGQPMCSKCQKYFRLLGTNVKTFDGSAELSQYHDQLFVHRVDSPQFAEIASAIHKSKPKKGSCKLELQLRGCPECKSQLLTKDIGVLNKNGWQSIDKLKQSFQLSPGINLISLIKSRR
jgi:hypothetical protein